jgi:hypothetical protein
MKKNPKSVTIFGAIHIGSNSTMPFHYPSSASFPRFLSSHRTKNKTGTYVMLEDIIRDQRLINARVFVGLEMHEGIIG